ncbi:hypothetical protein BKA61DRAFT_659619 [Leptodontidium sp. MPI-SDFR-AT-0119]|nr:hypothetical protein BKA61DRAFT_659619 [Leptodontidium sp. MPI-SDFR-AT-0119]
MVTPSNAQLEADYARFVSEAAHGSDKLKPRISRGLDRFKSLDAFLRIGDLPNGHSHSESRITIVTFHDDGTCKSSELPKWISDLPKEIQTGSSPKLIIVENLSPKAVRMLGGQLKIDPRFFSDYIDTMPSIFDVSKIPDRKRSDIIPVPWYNIEKVEPNLPMLSSLKSESSHIMIRYVGAREYEGGLKHKHLEERIDPDLTKMNVERTAGLHIPIQRNHVPFENIALTRHCTSIWFNTSKSVKKGDPLWTRGVVLLDPAFEVDDPGKALYGTRRESVYRSFVTNPQPFEAQERDIDSRDSYRDSIVHYLVHCQTAGAGYRHPLLILQGLARIITSEWLVVNTYVERDLNNIEWTLETENVTLEVFEGFIKRLFILRRRIGKYKTLVDDQLLLFQQQMPDSWAIESITDTESGVFNGMKGDLVQVQNAIGRNAGRVSQTLELITSIMSVREGESSIVQNQTLGFLTILATVALPFNTIATIVGLQTKYAPGEAKWGTYMIASSTAVGIIGTIYFLFRLYMWLRGHRVGLN